MPISLSDIEMQIVLEARALRRAWSVARPVQRRTEDYAGTGRAPPLPRAQDQRHQR